MNEIVPPGVVTCELFEDLAEAAAPLHPEELAQLSNAVDRRRRQFAGARWCAHRALAALRVPPAPLLSGPGGAPVWPQNVVGSLTHSGSYQAAAVSRADRFLALGIDAEPDAPLPDGVLASVATPREQGWAGAGRGETGQVWPDRLLFSAKEAVFKAWFPLTGRGLGFRQVIVEPRDPEAALGTFDVRLPGAGTAHPDLSLTGRWLARDGLLVTAVSAAPR